MKIPHSVLLILVPLLLLGCQPEIGFVESSLRTDMAEAAFFSGGDLAVDFTESAGSATFDLVTSGDWTASFVNDRAKDWCSLSLEEVKPGTAAVTLSVQDNPDSDDRSATVVFVSGNVKRTILVTQKQKGGFLKSGNQIEVGQAGGRITIELKSSIKVDYTIAKDAESWIKPLTKKGQKTSKILFDVAANNSVGKREGVITVIDPSQKRSEIVTVYQAGEEPSIILSQNEYSLSSEGQQIIVEVTHNVDVVMEIPSDCDWVEEVMMKSMSTNRYRLYVRENESTESRACRIVFGSPEWNLKELVTITQKGVGPVIELAGKYFGFGPEGGSLFVKLATNLDLEVDIQPDCDWISQVSTKSVSTQGFSFSVAKNHGRQIRQAWIAFKDRAQTCSDTVFVEQKPEPILVDQDTLSVRGFGGRVSFEAVGSDPGKYKLEMCDKWLSFINSESVSGHTRFSVCAEQQSVDAKPRDGIVLVHVAGYSVPDTLHIHQSGYSPVLSYQSVWKSVGVPFIEDGADVAFVDWGDGVQEPYEPTLLHRYSAARKYTVRIEILEKKPVSFDNLSGGMEINLREIRY